MTRRAGALGLLSGWLMGSLGALTGRGLLVSLLCSAALAAGLVLLLIDLEGQRGQSDDKA